MRDTIDDDDRAFIEAADMFFLATADANGRPQSSYKGGDPGFVSVIDERTIAFPSWDGNGMYLSAGNVLVNPHVGLLFIDFERRSRLRLNGVASIDEADPLLDAYPQTQFVVRVRATEVFPNCPRYIHQYRRALPFHAARGAPDAGAGMEAPRVVTRRAPGRRPRTRPERRDPLARGPPDPPGHRGLARLGGLDTRVCRVPG